MKKLINLILFGILMLFPIYVFADMGGPGPTGYNAKVSNSNGTDAQYVNGTKTYHLPYNTKIYVKYEEDDYAIISGKECKSFGCKKSSDYQIELDDITIDSNKDVEDESIVLDSVKKQYGDEYSDDLYNEVHQYYVFRKGAYFYKGPGKKYDKIESMPEVPVGTILSYKYFDDYYFYTEVNGQKGWVAFEYDVYDEDDEGNVQYVNHLANLVGINNKIYLSEETEMLDSSFKKTIGISIPANTTVTYKYETYEDFEYFYVTYNNKEGWIKIDRNSTYLDVSEFDYTLMALESLKLYKYIGSNKNVLDVKIGKNKEAKILYASIYTDYYVEYNGIKGWVKSKQPGDNAFLLSTNYINSDESNPYSYIRCLKKLYVYDGYKGNKTDKFVEKNDEFKVIYYNSYNSNGYVIDWYYVEKDGEFFWIKSSVKEEKDAKDSVEFIDEIKENVNPKQTIVEDTNDTAETSVKEVKDDLKLKVMYYGFAVIILIIVVLVTIKLVNKKKSVKEDKKVKKEKQNKDEEDE